MTHRSHFAVHQTRQGLAIQYGRLIDGGQAVTPMRAPMRFQKGVSSMRRLEENLKENDEEKREHERRWREILEELGPDVVRARFSARMPVWGERYGEKLPSNDFIVTWLAKKDVASRQAEARRFRLVTWMALYTLIASCFILIAAWIAAYPVSCAAGCPMRGSL